MPVTSDSAAAPRIPHSDPWTEVGLLSLAVVWGLNFAVVKGTMSQLDPLAFNALRFPLASLVLLGLLRSQRGRMFPNGNDLVPLVALGILGNVVYQLFFIFGLDWTLAGNASLLLATTPVWTTALSTLWGHERPGGNVWLGIAGTLAGMILVILGGNRAVGFDPKYLHGDLFMVGAAMCWSLYTVGCRPYIVRYGSLPVTAWTLWIGSVGTVAIGIPDLLDADLSRVSPGGWLGVAYAGCLAIGVAYALWYRGVRRIGNSRTAVYANLVPVVALLGAWVALGERPVALQLAGAALILAGVSLARFGGGAPEEA